MSFFTEARRPSNELGRRGEQIAESYLQQKGYELIEKNWFCKAGEVDLIFHKDEIIVFVEVKTRAESKFALDYLFSTVTPKKQRKLRLLADIFFSLHRNQLRNFKERIDLVGVIISDDGRTASYIEHREGAC